MWSTVHLPVPIWKDAMPYERRERIPSVKSGLCQSINMGKWGSIVKRRTRAAGSTANRITFPHALHVPAGSAYGSWDCCWAGWVGKLLCEIQGPEKEMIAMGGTALGKAARTLQAGFPAFTQAPRLKHALPKRVPQQLLRSPF